jgi:hypothetical protein
MPMPAPSCAAASAQRVALAPPRSTPKMLSVCQPSSPRRDRTLQGLTSIEGQSQGHPPKPRTSTIPGTTEQTELLRAFLAADCGRNAIRTLHRLRAILPCGQRGLPLLSADPGQPRRGADSLDPALLELPCLFDQVIDVSDASPVARADRTARPGERSAARNERFRGCRER